MANLSFKKTFVKKKRTPLDTIMYKLVRRTINKIMLLKTTFEKILNGDFDL